MEIKYSPEVQQWVEGMPRLQQASNLLAEILGPQSSQLVTGDWRRLQDAKGRIVYRLTIRDFAGEAFTEFAPDELENPLHMKVRMYRLWGDLLQVRNNQQHQQVQIISGQMASALEGH